MGFKKRGDSDPGYFAVLRALRAERQRGADNATRLADEVGDQPDRVRALGWAHVGDPGFVRTFYEQIAARDPDIALAIARLDAREGLPWLGLRVAGLESIAPLIAAGLEGDDPYPAIQLFLDAPDQFGRPLPGLRTVATSGDYWSRAALQSLAASPYQGDRQWALDQIGSLDPDNAVQIRAAAAAAGSGGHDQWLLDTLGRPDRDHHSAAETAIASGEARHLSRHSTTDRTPIIRAIGARRLAAAVGPLVELLYSFDFFDAVEALAAIGDHAAVAPLEAFAAGLDGDPNLVAPYQIFVDNALSALGRPRPVDCARRILDEPIPGRFGYIEEELYRVYAAAMAALVDRGTGADRRRVAGHLDIPLRLLREQAVRAYAALGEPVPRLSVYDPERVSRTGAAALVAALSDPGAIGKATIVEALLERGDSDQRRAAVRFARARLERFPNTWIDEPYDALPDCNELIAALETLEGDDRSLLEGTTSGWIRALVLDQGPMPYPAPPPLVSGASAARVERFDQLPFVFGAHINGMAVSADGLLMALVGDSFCKVIDARTGEFVAQLDPGWSWGYDCAFTADNTLVACFHGGHVESYEPRSGARIRDFVGHGGAPDGVKRVAVSPDGSTAVSVGQDGQVIGFDIATGQLLWSARSRSGSCEAVAFSPDGAEVTASHVKTGAGQLDYLTVHQPRTGESRDVEMRSSIWAIAYSPDGRHVAVGGAGNRVRLCDRSFATLRDLDLANTTRLAFSPDGKSLVGCSSDGVVKRWALDRDDGGEVLLESGAALWSMVVTPSGQVWTVGSSGALHRIGAAPLRGESHSAQITGIERLGDALITGSWDGRVLEWPLSGGVGRERLAIDGRVNRLASDGGRIYAATATGLYTIGRGGAELLDSSEHDEIGVAGDRLARGVGVDLEIVALPSCERLSVTRVGSDDVSAVCPFPGGFLAGSEEGEVSFVSTEGELQWLRADHGSDRLDHGNSHKDICGLVATPTALSRRATTTRADLQRRAAPRRPPASRGGSSQAGDLGRRRAARDPFERPTGSLSPRPLRDRRRAAGRRALRERAAHRRPFVDDARWWSGPKTATCSRWCSGDRRAARLPRRAGDTEDRRRRPGGRARAPARPAATRRDPRPSAPRPQTP